jgi:hypothetical protein
VITRNHRLKQDQFSLQFFEGRSKNQALEPIKRLMLAVLTDAVRCYQVGADAQKISCRRAFREAEEWLFRTNAEWSVFIRERVLHS